MIELKENPLKDRIVKVFSSNPEIGMTFDDFLNMMSVFSEAAPDSVKCYYAFKIYDFSGRKCLTKSDIKTLIQTLIGENKIENSKMELLINKVKNKLVSSFNKNFFLNRFLKKQTSMRVEIYL